MFFRLLAASTIAISAPLASQANTTAMMDAGLALFFDFNTSGIVSVNFKDVPFNFESSFGSYVLRANAINDGSGRSEESGSGRILLTNTSPGSDPETAEIDIGFGYVGSILIEFDGPVQDLTDEIFAAAIAGFEVGNQSYGIENFVGNNVLSSPGFSELGEFNPYFSSDGSGDDLSIKLPPGQTFVIDVDYLAYAGMPRLPEEPGVDVPLPPSALLGLSGLGLLALLRVGGLRRRVG